MKNSKKKPTFKMPRAFLFTATCILLGFNLSYGQPGTYVPANLPNRYWIPVSQPTLLNNAVYDYGRLQSPPVYGQLVAMTGENGTSCGFRLDDGYQQLSAAIPAIPNTYNTAPDVIIGTDQFGPAYDPRRCLVAIAYTRVYTSITAREIRLAVFQLSGLGTGALTATPYTDIAISDVGTEPYAEEPHIDIVAEYIHPYPATPPNLPLCDQFIVTWGDNDPQPTGKCGVWTYYNKLSTLSTPGNRVQIYPISGVIYKRDFYPDVAAVQRKVYVGSGIGTVGEFTFFDAITSNLLYAEYDFLNPPTSVSATVLDNGNLSARPRIAGVDDITQNNPTVMHMSPYYVVEATQNYSPYNGIYGYYNILGTPGVTFLSYPVTAGAEHSDIPAVTTGPEAHIYTVSFSDMLDSNLVAEKVDWNTGEPTGFPFNNYYQVNDTDTVGNPHNLNYQYRLHAPVNLAIATSCNTNCTADTGELFINWGDGYYIFQKNTGSPFVFRPGATSITNISNQSIFTAAPNPVNDKLQLSGPVGITDSYMYSLTDMLGRTLQQASITQNRQTVDVSNCPEGMYLLNIYKNGQSIQTMKVLKE